MADIHLQTIPKDCLDPVQDELLPAVPGGALNIRIAVPVFMGNACVMQCQYGRSFFRFFQLNVHL